MSGQARDAEQALEMVPCARYQPLLHLYPGGEGAPRGRGTGDAANSLPWPGIREQRGVCAKQVCVASSPERPRARGGE